MNYEQKYKEALERAKEELRVCGSQDCDAARQIFRFFPELENKDERIRKELIEFLKLPHSRFVGNREHEKWIAWLEKQSEKDPCIGCTNDKGCVTCENGNLKEIKIEQKFEVGDWIIGDEGIFEITQYEDEYGYEGIFEITQYEGEYGYELTDTTGSVVHFVSPDYVETNYHLWTIQDAKDGDLIYVSTETKGIQAIFHKFENGIIYFHCNLCGDFTQGGYEPSGDVKSVNPLLKEHYQRFFQKMKEAGYEWDRDKKELKKDGRGK